MFRLALVAVVLAGCGKSGKGSSDQGGATDDPRGPTVGTWDEAIAKHAPGVAKLRAQLPAIKKAIDAVIDPSEPPPCSVNAKVSADNTSFLDYTRLERDGMPDERHIEDRGWQEVVPEEAASRALFWTHPKTKYSSSLHWDFKRPYGFSGEAPRQSDINELAKAAKLEYLVVGKERPDSTRGNLMLDGYLVDVAKARVMCTIPGTHAIGKTKGSEQQTWRESKIEVKTGRTVSSRTYTTGGYFEGDASEDGRLRFANRVFHALGIKMTTYDPNMATAKGEVLAAEYKKLETGAFAELDKHRAAWDACQAKVADAAAYGPCLDGWLRTAAEKAEDSAVRDVLGYHVTAWEHRTRNAPAEKARPLPDPKKLAAAMTKAGCPEVDVGEVNDTFGFPALSTSGRWCNVHITDFSTGRADFGPRHATAVIPQGESDASLADDILNLLRYQKPETWKDTVAALTDGGFKVTHKPEKDAPSATPDYIAVERNGQHASVNVLSFGFIEDGKPQYSDKPAIKTAMHRDGRRFIIATGEGDLADKLLAETLALLGR